MSKKFDSNTARKIINEYADRINYYIKENLYLKDQLQDIKITLNINKDLMFKSMNEVINDNLLEDLKNENLRLTEVNNKSNEEKEELLKKIYKLQIDYESKNIKEIEELEKAKDEIFMLNNKLKEKDSTISFLRKENEKYSHNDSYDKKIYIIEPNKSNIDINNELNATRDILAKISKLLNSEKIKNEKITQQLNHVNHQIESLRSGNLCNGCIEKAKQGDKNDVESEEEEIDDDEEDDLEVESEESASIKFPDKVKMSLNEKQVGIIPKLDFTKVQEKYMSEGLKKTVNKELKKPLNKYEEIIEKLRNDLKEAYKSIEKLTTKLEKFKKLYKNAKDKIAFKNDELRKSSIKIESLETQIRKSVIGSTDDISNKRYESIYISEATDGPCSKQDI